MPAFVYIATSLDGFIAGKDGNIDWLNNIPNPTNSDFGYFEFMKGIDAVLLGRKSYETVLGFDQWFYNKPVFVLSTTMKEEPPKFKGKVEFLNGSPREVLEGLEARGFKNIYVDGGVTIQGFVREGLIDEMTITKVPIVLGSGFPLFGNDGMEMEFRHVETIVFNDFLVRSKYVRK
jgi:dihydrofolate reductase